MKGEKSYEESGIIILTLTMVLSLTVNFQVKPVVAENFDFNYIEVETGDLNTRRVLLIDEFGLEHIVEMNYQTMTLIIDGEIIQFEVTEMSLPRATIDYSSKMYITGRIPWKESVTLLVVAFKVAIPGIDPVANAMAKLVINSVKAGLLDLYFSFNQYKSVEEYYFSYHGTYYNKMINKDITIRRDSLSGTVLAGPSDGGWFDPIRPA